MSKVLLWVALLVGACGLLLAEENPGQLAKDVLNGIPGVSASWAETYMSFSGWAPVYPFFSPAIVRIGDTEEYMIVQSRLFYRDDDAYAGTFFFVVLFPDDPLSFRVIPASGVEVSYRSNVPPLISRNEVEDKIRSAGTLMREYEVLKRQVRGSGFLTASFTLIGLLSGAGCIWIETSPSAPNVLKSSYGIFLGISAPVALWMAIDAMQTNGSNVKRMEEIRNDLRTLWQ
jgi:hypothetical protein